MFEIRLEKLTKRFGNGLVAVDSADLEVGHGEVMCLLGPSGCGKTTMLRMIAGLEWATSGDIMIAGKRVNDLPARERNVAMAFQFYALYPSLSVEDNLAYPLHAENLSKAEIASRVARVSEALDLKAILKRRPHQLGEGEKQRVAVGRSIVRDPTCFLFDEPLSRLDIQLRQTMRTQIKEILAKLDKPTVIVTHDQIEALTMADRIAVMQTGQGRASRHAARVVFQADESVRRELHRHAADEFAVGDARRRRTDGVRTVPSARDSPFSARRSPPSSTAGSPIWRREAK